MAGGAGGGEQVPIYVGELVRYANTVGEWGLFRRRSNPL